MFSYSHHKVDLNDEYPCPCNRKGCLKPMILMDAYGCTRCQQIFVLQDNGYIIEQVSTIYPYKRCYTWNGHRWKPLREKKRLIWLIITIMMALPIIVIFIPLVLIVTNSGNLIVSIALVMVMLMILIFWLFA